MSETYEAIYRRFRPQTFDKVLGQKHVVNVLRSQIASGNIPHAYLFSGTRGTGKTTMARLLAKALNCLSDGERPCGECANCKAIADGNFVDVLELDAASNNSVDDIRQLTEITAYPPTMGKKRVIILDEAHMLSLSRSASNALLKTLEEPPSDTIFILATTEENKLLPTIRSRCLSFEFKRVPIETITEGLTGITKELGVSADTDALGLIAANADGSVRNAISILEACIPLSEGNITRETVLEAIGSPGDEKLAALVTAIFSGKTTESLAIFAETLQDGKEARRVLEDWIEYLRAALLIKYLDKPEAVLNRSLENIAKIRETTKEWTDKALAAQILSLSKLHNESRWAAKPALLVEMRIVELCAEANKKEAKE